MVLMVFNYIYGLFENGKMKLYPCLLFRSGKWKLILLNKTSNLTFTRVQCTLEYVNFLSPVIIFALTILLHNPGTIRQVQLHIPSEISKFCNSITIVFFFILSHVVVNLLFQLN